MAALEQDGLVDTTRGATTHLWERALALQSRMQDLEGGFQADSRTLAAIDSQIARNFSLAADALQASDSSPLASVSLCVIRLLATGLSQLLTASYYRRPHSSYGTLSALNSLFLSMAPL